MNEKIAKIREIAKRTLKILDMIEEGRTSREIVEKLGVDRQLADYYWKIAREK